MKGKRERMLSQKGQSEKQICVYEFDYKGACTMKEKCAFNHKITENQRNDPLVVEEISNKIEKIKRLRKLRAGGKDAAEERVAVPKVMLEQMYQLLHNSSCF